MQPSPQLARTHRRDGLIENTEQRMFDAAARVDVQLQIAPCRRVERDRFVRTLDGQAGEMWQGGFLRLLDICEQTSRGGDRQWQVFAAEPREIVRTEKLTQVALRGFAVEVPRGAFPESRKRAHAGRPFAVFVN